MCNLYRMNRAVAEVARTFHATPGACLKTGLEIYPGYPALVIAGSRVKVMTWGFPIGLMGQQDRPLKPRRMNNTRADMLGTSFWHDSFKRHRCLVPVSNFFEAEGQMGRRTGTWFSVPGQDLFAFAGIWRNSVHWGQCFSIVTTDANPDMAPIHGRMPVIVAPDDWRQWQFGSCDEAKALCRPWAGELAIERTAQAWSGR